MPVNIRPAQNEDYLRVKKLLEELYLYYADLAFKDFWVAESKGKIVGAVQIEEFKDFLFLGSLGVAADQQNHGIAKALLDKILKNQKKDVYLYTIIPEFFKKLGFKTITPNSQLRTPNFNLPTKSRYECESCHSDQCVTMVRHAA